MPAWKEHRVSTGKLARNEALFLISLTLRITKHCVSETGAWEDALSQVQSHLKPGAIDLVLPSTAALWQDIKTDKWQWRE